MSTPKKNTAYTLYTPLVDSADPGSFKANPTIAAGDFKVSVDGGTFANLTTLPVVTPATSTSVKIELTAAEMNGDKITVQGIDTSGAEWSDISIFLDVDINNLDDVSNQVSQIANVGGSVNTPASGYVLTTGSLEANLYTDTYELDQVYHQHSDTDGALNLYYEFDVGSEGVPTAVDVTGRLMGLNDSLDGIYAYNWVTTSWDIVGAYDGQATPTDVTRIYDLYTSHVGTGSDLGKVRIRFYAASGLSSANLYIDRIFCSYAIVVRSVGYANGAIWIDTNNGTAGTTPYINGTADNPALTLSEAITLSGTVGVKRFEVAQGSILIFNQTMNGYEFHGTNYVVNLNNQIVGGNIINGAAISGVGLAGGGRLILNSSAFLAVTLPLFFARECTLTDVTTLGEAGAYILDTCISAIAGTGSPFIDFNASLNASQVSFRHYSGGMEFLNMGQGTGDYNVSLEGQGQFIINANCIGGHISVRGSYKKTDYSGLIDIDDTANSYSPVIQSGLSQGGTANTIILSTLASAVDGAYDPCGIFIFSGTGKGQSRNGYQYDGATRTLIVDRDWKVVPDVTSDYRIIYDSGREHVNEGLARGGTLNTIQLNVLASTITGAYNGQLAFLRSGTGEDQVGLIISYDGATQIATIDRNWGVIPDNTTGYALLPTHIDHGAAWDALTTDHTIPGSFGAALNLIKDIESGNWEIVNNQMIFKDQAGVEVLRCDLFSIYDTPSQENVYKRVVVP